MLAPHQQTARSISLCRLGADPVAHCLVGRRPRRRQARSAVRCLVLSSPHAGAAPASKSNPNRPLVTLSPSPRDSRPAPPPELARILAGPPSAAPGDPIASSLFFPVSWVQSKDLLVRNLKLSGAGLQKGISNSTCVLLILVNSVENRRKIRKMQTQFCWLLFEKSYNFCCSCLS
jgi:hypothetical protein